MLEGWVKALVEGSCFVVSNLEVGSPILAKEVAEGIRILASFAGEFLQVKI